MVTLPIPAGWRGMPVDPARAARAHGLAVEPQGDGSYLVRSVYLVQLDDVTMPVCECADHTYGDGLCKHAVAAMDYERTRAEP